MLVLLTASPADARSEVWYRQFSSAGGNPFQQLDWAFDVATDGAGNVYAVGTTDQTLPGQTSSGSRDAFIRSYDPAGTELWTRQFGTSGADDARGVALDGSGGVYVAGNVTGALPGQTYAGVNDAFVRKYDTAGNELWTRQFGTAGGEGASAAAVDGTGNVYWIGLTTGAFPGFSNSNPVEVQTVVRKYDSSGIALWTQQFGTTNRCCGTGQRGGAADAAGNLYIVGSTGTGGTLEGPGVTGTGPTWIAKFAPDGTRQWARQFGGDQYREFSDVAVDPSGNARVSGLRPNPNPILALLGSITGFVRTYRPNGTVLSTHNVRGPGPRSMALDGAGATYLLAGGSNVTLTKVAADGTFLWQEEIRREGSQDALALAIDPGENLLVAGGADHTADESSESADAFVMKVDQAPTCADTGNPTASEDGTLSRPIHLRVEPVTNGLEPTVHEVNCTVVVPLGL